MIDPASRWVYSEIAPQRDAPRPQDSMAMIVNGLLSLRAGILKYDTDNKSNVFDQSGALVHTLTLATDQGNELGGNKPEYRGVRAGRARGQDARTHITRREVLQR